MALVAGQAVTADELAVATAKAETKVIKAADESLTTNTTPQNDDHLFLSVAANSTYEFHLWLIYSAGTTGRIRIDFTGPAGATFNWSAIALGSSITTNPGSIQRDLATLAGFKWLGAIGAGSQLVADVTGMLVTAGTSGTLRLRWCQVSSDAAATVVYAQSFMVLTKV